MIDYVFSEINPTMLAFIIGFAGGMFFELFLVLIVEKIGGKINEWSRHQTNKEENKIS